MKQNEEMHESLADNQVDEASDQADVVLEGPGETEEIIAEAVEAEVAEMTDTVDWQAQFKESEVKYMRLSADFANFKKRTDKEKSDIYRLGNEKIMNDLLPVIDNFERALSHADEGSKESFVKGVQMIHDHLMDVLKKEGLTEIQAMGQPFNPSLHHAVIQEETEDFESDHVIAVLQKGYTLNEKVIRPSMVKVAQ